MKYLLYLQLVSAAPSPRLCRFKVFDIAMSSLSPKWIICTLTLFGSPFLFCPLCNTIFNYNLQMHQKASILKPLWSHGYIEVPAPMWISQPSEEQWAGSFQLPSCCFSVFKFIPHFLYCALPTTGISSITSSMRAWIMTLKFPILVGGSIFHSLPSPVVVYKAVWAGTCRNHIFCDIPVVWTWGCDCEVNETLSTLD